MTTVPCSGSPNTPRSFQGTLRSLLGDSSGAVRMRHVALPTEHGGWGFILEPIVLGLAVAPTLAGSCIGLAAFFGFLTRQPLKTAMLDHLRGRTYPRTVVARRFVVLYGAVGVAALVAALALAGPSFLLPFAAVTPLAFLQLWYDARNESRSLLPELTGPIAIASVTPAIMLAAGSSLSLGASLWALLIARSLPTILYVRGRLRLERGGGAVAPVMVAVAHIAAVVVALTLEWSGGGSLLAVAALVILMMRAVVGLSPFRSRISAKTLGFRELGLGAFTIVLFAAGAWTGF